MLSHSAQRINWSADILVRMSAKRESLRVLLTLAGEDTRAPLPQCTLCNQFKFA